MSDLDIYRRLMAIEADLERLRKADATVLRHGARVYNSAAISIASGGGGTLLTFDSERYDPSGLHSTSVNTGRLTILVTGIYLVGFAGEFASNATGYRQIGIYANGTTNLAIDIRPAVNGSSTSFAIVTAWGFSAGDYVEIAVFQNSGAPLNINASGNWSPEFWIQRCP